MTKFTRKLRDDLVAYLQKLITPTLVNRTAVALIDRLYQIEFAEVPFAQDELLAHMREEGWQVLADPGRPSSPDVMQLMATKAGRCISLRFELNILANTEHATPDDVATDLLPYLQRNS